MIKVLSILLLTLTIQSVVGQAVKENRKIKDWKADISSYGPQAQDLAAKYGPELAAQYGPQAQDLAQKYSPEIAQYAPYGEQVAQNYSPEVAQYKPYVPDAQQLAQQYAPQGQELAAQYGPAAQQYAENYKSYIPQIEEMYAGGKQQLEANYPEVQSAVLKYYPEAEKNYPAYKAATTPDQQATFEAYAVPAIQVLNGKGATIDFGDDKSITIGPDGKSSVKGLDSQYSQEVEDFFAGKTPLSSLEGPAQEAVKQIEPELKQFYESQGPEVQNQVKGYLSPQVWEQIPQMSSIVEQPTASTTSTPATPADSNQQASGTLTITFSTLLAGALCCVMLLL